MSYRPYYEEKYIPDMTTWTSFGTSLFENGKILRIGNTLYSFGGRDIGTGTDTGKIWTASWDNFNNFTYSGTTVAALNNNTTPSPSAACIIDSTIYNYGSTIWSTQVSNPISGWATTSVALPNQRDNYGFVVTQNFIGMYNGGDFTNVNAASISSPTSFSALSTTIGGWEKSACYLDDPSNSWLSDTVIVLGGLSTNTRISFYDSKTANLSYLDTTSGFVSEKNATIFHIGNKIYTIGSNGTTMYYAYTKNLTVWYTITGVLPGSTRYVGMNSWISKDGYAYIINQGGGIYRSNRKKIYVLDPPNPNGKYTHRRAVDDTGADTLYTIHCQMGMAPWLTNRRDAF